MEKQGDRSEVFPQGFDTMGYIINERVYEYSAITNRLEATYNGIMNMLIFRQHVGVYGNKDGWVGGKEGRGSG